MGAWKRIGALIAALAAVPAAGHAQIYPARPIRVIVPTAAGGAGDIVARAVGQKLTDSWGQQVIVDLLVTEGNP